MSLFPVFAALQGRRVVVIGGGPVAARKVELLRRTGAAIEVVAPELCPALAGLAARGELVHVRDVFSDAALDGAWLAIAATGDRLLNLRIAAAADARRVFVNVVDDARLSSFQVPSIVDRSPVLIAISSGGAAPVLARRIRARIESLFDASLGPLAALIARYRSRIRRRWPDVDQRRRFFDRLLDGEIAADLRRQQPERAEQRLRAALADAARDEGVGSVVLVGAGPGDPGLLTLAGLRALNEADVILHDHLASDAVLELARRDAERIAVGKRGGGAHTAQEHIHSLMLEHARAGRRVVRLKGGDPFVFGRGGEELEFLRAHGIAYEVIPGITAAIACAAHAGIPLTHRGHAQSVRLLTAHCRDSVDRLDWQALADDRQTLCVYMGVGLLETLQARLLERGRDPSTPFALVENGTRADQRVIRGTLGKLSEAARIHAVRAPALLILGAVAALSDTLHWHGAAPLTADPVALDALRAA